ncbi:MAG TPA: S8 family peptidase, partial [Actinomycetota bacterium]|nr:S8 family peptidase [Actinomycetota bacterium]
MLRGLVAAFAVCALALTGAFSAADGANRAGPAELLVRFEPGARQSEALASVGATLVERLPLRGLVRVRLESGASAAAADAALERRSDVAYAEPNALYDLYATPDDPNFPDLWGMAKIGAPAAWDSTTGSDSVTVAVVDSGVDYTHPDLAANIWSNADETPANGLDDDANGFADDVRGWDFYSGDADPQDLLGHGTHVAGTVGARGNNATDVAGVNWRVKLMPLRVGDQQLTLSAIVGGFAYACANGARVINGSFGGTGHDAMRDAIVACPNALFIFAAGNEAHNNDAMPTYPCSYPLANVVCVAATGADDTRAWFSNWGAVSVDLAAPGTNILSTVPADQLDYYDGTSMAAPHVAGAAALVLAARPQLTTAELRNALLLSVDPKPS